jgi:hemolysin activation/secretion protein
MPDFFRNVCLLLLALGCALPLATRAAGADTTPRFDVWEYRVAGNTVLPAVELEKALYPHLGPQRSMTDVEAARQQLEALYRDRGYGTVFIDVPEQDVVDGLVRLQVTEGRLESVKVSGPRYFSAGRIRGSLPALQAGEVVNLQSLQRELTAVNRQSPDRQVTPVLRAGSKPGAVGVELKVKDELPFHASVDVNNRYTADTTQTRAGVNLSYDNLFQKFHRLSLQYQTAPENPDETRVLAATYIAPVRNDLVAGYIVDTSSDFATLSGIGSLSVLGTGRIYGLRYIRNLPEAAGRYHSLTFGMDYKDFEDRIQQPDGLTDTTPMRYINWSAAYGSTWQSATQSTTLNAALNFGIRGAGNTPDEFEFKRYKAPANYLYLRASAQHQRPLFGGTSLLLRVAGQVTPEPVISNEQFAIGGADTVRGYLEAEQLGDDGLAATVELRSPQFVALLPEQLEQAYVFGFVDGGVVGILDPLPVDGQRTSSYSLSSAGVGLRVAGFGGLQTELEWAYPFEATDDTARGDSRLHFQVLYGF